MSELTLTLACWDYDRTRPLIDGRAKPEGFDLQVTLMRPQQAFQAMLQRQEFHAAEMSLANYTALKAKGDCPFIGIPVMLSKMFRHSCIYVRSDAGIRTPSDLKGRRAGTAQFTSTGVVFVKGALQHDHGVSQNDMSWVVGPLHSPGPVTKFTPPPGVKVDYVPEGRTLEQMFEGGEIDVLFSNHFPHLWESGWPGIVRLFPNFKAVEQDYYKRTGIFPIMHTVVLREDVVRDHPVAAKSLYDAFCKARDIAADGLYDTDALRLSLPWLIDHIEETRRVVGPDFFTYGLAPNRKTVAALAQYLHEQGLAPRVVAPEELFVPGIG
jgi:4,5-dihydroxyphthalate decarboxylase